MPNIKTVLVDSLDAVTPPVLAGFSLSLESEVQANSKKLKTTIDACRIRNGIRLEFMFCLADLVSFLLTYSSVFDITTQ